MEKSYYVTWNDQSGTTRRSDEFGSPEEAWDYADGLVDGRHYNINVEDELGFDVDNPAWEN